LVAPDFLLTMRHLFVLLATATCLVTTSCSNSRFEKQWRAAVAQPAAANSIEGPWQGKWISQGNGHSGKLRCIVGPATDKAGTHAFHYHATWAHLLSGGFTAKAVVQQQGKNATFKGKQSLGKYGTFESAATITGRTFHSTYKAVGDHGIFEMTRPNRE
jgi:hypothetical protein